MASMRTVVSEKGRLYVLVGKTRYPAEAIDEEHYRVLVPLRRLRGLSFRDLPLLSREGEQVIVEIMPLATRGEDEYTYRVRGLSFYDNLVIWRNGEKGYVYLEKVVQTSSYAYTAWMPLRLYTYIASMIAGRHGYSVEASEDPGYVVIETEKTYSLEHPVADAVKEAREMDEETARIMGRLEKKAKTNMLKLLSKNLGIPAEELEEAAGNIEKASTIP